ncbi:hypothetical protein [Streptomyces nigra]|uniref:hypothetical protein n=1 Tax=Streptomyces nigra TaxID=1827580 RepID=UPI0035E12923
MALDQGSPSEPGANVFHEAMSSVTGTAKWIIGVSAVVAGVLLTGVSLKDISNLDTDHPERLVLAGVAVVLALVMVSLIIKFASDVLTVPDTTLSKLAAYEVGREQPSPAPDRPIPSVADYDDVLGYLAQLKGEVQPDPDRQDLSVQQLYNQYVTTMHSVDELRRGQQVTVGNHTFGPGDKDNVNQLKEELVVLERRAALLQDAAQFYYVQRKYKTLKVAMVVGVVVITLAIFGFTWATRSSGVSINSPIEERFYVSKNLTALKEAGIDQRCAGRTLSAVAVGGTIETPRIMTRAEPGCPGVTVDVTDSLGRAVPADKGRSP